MSLTFVVSTGRCGSTMLSHVLAMHPDVLSASEFLNLVSEGTHADAFAPSTMDGRQLWRKLSAAEPHIDGLVTAGLKTSEMLYPYGTGRFTPATGIPMICHNVLPPLTADPDGLYERLAAEISGWPPRPPAAQYRAVLEKLAELTGGSALVERSGGSLGLIGTLRREYPDARFVHMHRNGPDTALSMSRHSAARLAVLLQKAAAAAGLPPATPWREIVAAAPPEFDGLLSAPFDAGRFRTYPISLTIFAWIWSVMVKEGVRALAALPRDIWTDLRYEDIVRDPRGELTRLAGFIGVPASEEWLARGAAYIDDSRTGSAAAQLPPRELAAVRAACESATRALAGLQSAAAAA